MSDSCLGNNVIIFTKDLEQDDLQWNVKAWINGINIEGEEKCIISDKVIIKKLQAKDFELEGISHEINSLSDDPILDFPIAPTIIEFCDFEEKVSDINQYLELILDALKLYRCGSVFCSRIDMEPESFLNNKTISKSNFNSVALHQYSIKDDDFNDIIAFVEFLKSRNFNRNYSS